MAARLRVKELAEAKGLNMSQLQRRSGLTMGMVRRYWYNEGKEGQLDGISLAALGRIAQVLGVQPGELITSEHVSEARGGGWRDERRTLRNAQSDTIG